MEDKDNEFTVIESYKEIENNSEQLNNLESAKVSPVKEFFAFFLDLLKTGVIIFVVAFAVRYFAIQPFIVDGESMMPNYVNNEYLLAEKVSYLFGGPKRGDTVVFKYPRNPNINYIKRIIGLPGETVKIKDGKVIIINSDYPAGIILSESYLSSNINTNTNRNNEELTQIIGRDEYFVMGDNRPHSSDSREWGVLPKQNIAGRAWLTLMPLNKFSVHHHVNYNVSY